MLGVGELLDGVVETARPSGCRRGHTSSRCTARCRASPDISAGIHGTPAGYSFVLDLVPTRVDIAEAMVIRKIGMIFNPIRPPNAAKTARRSVSSHIEIRP